MIIKGNRHNNGPKLARYITSGELGERAELAELRGFASENIVDAFRDVHNMADARGIENPFFHVQVRLPEADALKPEQWRLTADRIEKRLGLNGQPRAITFHINEATGERHMHIAFSLIDEETLHAKPVPFFKLRLKALARELEKEFDITRVKNEREGPIKYAAKKNEQQQSQRLGLDKDEIRNTIRACWDQSDCGNTFQAALEHEGMMLAKGDQRGLVVADHAGGVHALGKRILDVNKKAILQHLADLDLDELPTVDQARAYLPDYQQGKRKQPQIDNSPNGDRANQQEPDHAPPQPTQFSPAVQSLVADLCARYFDDLHAYHAEMPGLYDQAPDIAREVEQRVAAALQAEIDGVFPEADYSALFDEPQPAHKTRAAGRTNEPEPPGQQKQPLPWDRDRANKAWENAVMSAAIEQEKTARQFVDPKPDKSEARAGDRKKETGKPPLGRTAGEIRRAYSLTKTGQEFANAIKDRGSILARVTDADAARLNRWERARLEHNEDREKVYGRYERYKPGELLVVDQWANIHQLTTRNTGHDVKARAERLKDIDRAPLLSVTAAQGVMREVQQYRQEERRQAWQQQREEWLRPAREQHWPTMPQQPERKAPGLFHQAATEAARDERTANLRGTAAQVWKVYRESGNEKAFAAVPKANELYAVKTGDGKAFAAALENRGIAFAVVTKDEADRSNSKEAAFIRAVGNYAPRYKEGEIVLVTEPRAEFRQNGEITEPRRVHKLDQSLAEKFIKTLDNRSQLKGIEATKQALDERAQKRAAEWEAIRLENATNIKSRADTAAADLKKGIHKSAFVAGNVFDGLGKGFHALSSAFDSLISPKLSPEQIYESEKATMTREADAQRQIDWSNYAADRAQERQNNQEQQAARDRQRESELER